MVCCVLCVDCSVVIVVFYVLRVVVVCVRSLSNPCLLIVVC